MTMLTDLTQSASDLVKFAREGDKIALERCLSQCLEPAYRHAYSLVGNESDAQDITQEALLQLTRSAKRFEEGRSLSPWLAKHVSDASYRFRRSETRRRLREQKVAIMESQKAEIELSEIDREAIQSALRELSERDQELIGLHYFAELSQAECAEALDISENTCSVRIHRARKKLKSLLLKRGITAGLLILPSLAQAAPSTPGTLLPQVVELCTASSLPKTILPLSILQQSSWIIMTHPLLSACIAFITIGFSLLPFTLQAESTQTEEHVSQHPWNKEARELLQLHDRDALFQVATDMEFLRNELLNTKPGTLFQDEALRAKWHDALHKTYNWNSQIHGLNFIEVFNQSQGSLILVDSAPNQKPEAIMAFAYKGEEDTPNTKAHNSSWKDDGIVNGYEVSSRSDQSFAFKDNQFLLVNNNRDYDWFRQVSAENKETKSNISHAPLWLSFNGGKLVSRYKEAFGSRSGNVLIDYLGEDWKNTDPQVFIEFGSNESQEIQIKGIIEDLRVAGPWLALKILDDYIFRTEIKTRPITLQLPQTLPPRDPNALVELRFGSNLPLYIDDYVMLDYNVRQSLKSWNGDCLIRVHENGIMPIIDVVLGCHSYNENLAMQVARLISGGTDPLVETPSEAYLISYQASSFIGPIKIAQTKDKLIISMSGKLNELVATSEDDCHLSLIANLPKIAERYLPTLLNTIPEQIFSDIFRDTRLENIERLLGMNTIAIDDAIIKNSIHSWLGRDLNDISEFYNYINYYTPMQNSPQLKNMGVYKVEEGYIVYQEGGKIDLSRTMDLNSAKALLENYRLSKGKGIEFIKTHPRGAVPNLSKQELIPSVAEISKHLPHYQLRWWQENTDQRFEEIGLPLIGTTLFMTCLTLSQVNPEQEVEVIYSSDEP